MRYASCAMVLAAVVGGGAGQCAAAQPSAAQEAPAGLQLPRGTPVRLMVIKEVNSRSAKPGDRFKLRVDEAVVLSGTTVIPVGATAWGELVDVSGTTVAGGKGRLSARLLYVDLPSGRIPISGVRNSEGKANTAGVVMGILSFGLTGLLNKGGNATLKAGDILVGQVADDGAAPAPRIAPATEPRTSSTPPNVDNTAGSAPGPN